MADEKTSVTYEKGRLYSLRIADILPNPNQPRKYMDPQALEDLAASIAQHGVLTPILFRLAPAGEAPVASTGASGQLQEQGQTTPEALYVVAGERRCLGGTQENHPGPVENQNGNPDIGKT